MYTTRKEARDAGWHSRRHQAPDAHDKTRREYQKGRLAKKNNAQKRAKEASERTPKQQLGRLNRRLGKGVGATKERARLMARLKTQ